MNLFQAFVLGIIQGLTEFIPVSSTAHLLIAQHFLGIPANDAAFAFSVLVQLGTIISLIFYFWNDLLAILTVTLKNLASLRNFNSLPLNAKLGWYIAIATIPALLAGVAFKHLVESLFRTPLLEASIRLLSTAVLMTLAESLARKDRKMDSMNWIDALIVGLFQIIAVFPGASRSGTTISGGMFRGFDRASAARFAFLMSVPVMLAAGAYESLDVFKMANPGSFLPMIAVGSATAAIVGWLAIKWLLNYLSKNSLYVFAMYCAIVGVILFFLK